MGGPLRAGLGGASTEIQGEHLVGQPEDDHGGS